MSTDRFRHPHFEQLHDLLALESTAEQQQLHAQIQRASGNAERKGNTLTQLSIREEESGLGGRVLVTLGKRNEQLSLPWSRLRSGSPVQLTEENSDHHWRGVVTQLRRETVQVALPTWPESEQDRPTYRLDLAGDEVARRREENALVVADQARGNRLAELREVLLGEGRAYFEPTAPFTSLNPQLNPSQAEAISYALSATDLAMIHGPPGTGKTTAVIELIRQAVQRGERVLACAPSNLAVDNLLERLVAAPELRSGSVLRMGHPARVSPALRDHTLEFLVEEHEDMRLVRRLTKEAHALRADAARYTRAKPLPGERQEKRAAAKAMLSDARRVEQQLVERLLREAQVICSTLAGLDEEFLGDQTFDLCVIDEAAQSIEPSNWIPLRFCRRLVLAGDHQQLPPTIVSNRAAENGLGISLMERLMQAMPEVARQLTVQYRMHSAIMNFSSAEFYGGTLVAERAVAEHLLADLPHVQPLPLTTVPVQFIDTAGADYSEALEEDGESRLNEAEAGLVVQKVLALLETGVTPDAISVITPYSAQVRHLRALLGQYLDMGLEVGTVDGMQGREADVVIISLVRSNDEGAIGFLADTRRMNVALTRARRKLIVIGDSATIGGDPFYGRLLDYFDTIDAYHTVWEEL